MQTPDDPRYDEVARLDQRGGHNSQRRSYEPNNNKADLYWRPRVSACFLPRSSLYCMFRGFRISSRVHKRLCAEPEADVVYWYSEVLEGWVPEKEPEDVENVVTVVGQSVGMDNRVEVYCE